MSWRWETLEATARVQGQLPYVAHHDVGFLQLQVVNIPYSCYWDVQCVGWHEGGNYTRAGHVILWPGAC